MGYLQISVHIVGRYPQITMEQNLLDPHISGDGTGNPVTSRDTNNHLLSEATAVLTRPNQSTIDRYIYILYI